MDGASSIKFQALFERIYVQILTRRVGQRLANQAGLRRFL
jgi:hypothetical protein